MNNTGEVKVTIPWTVTWVRLSRSKQAEIGNGDGVGIEVVILGLTIDRFQIPIEGVGCGAHR